MNIISFTYTKQNGNKTERVISPAILPNTMYEGTDLSELSDEEQVQYVQELSKLHDTYKQAVLALNNNFDVNNKYRRFDPTKMTNVITEAI